ncbi:MAG: hypothetical protein GX594_07485 [Pirellulaceae bacterium]|nr:hypothetical protein [Pirellulaceae bacterium]
MRTPLRIQLEAACRRIYPERTVYIVLASEAPRDFICPTAGAYCARHLDLTLRECLADRWTGRGAAMLLNDRAIWRCVRGRCGRRWNLLRNELAAACVHELSHVVSRPVIQSETETNPIEARPTSEYLRQFCATPITEREARVRWAGHDAGFIRTAEHVGCRMQRQLDFRLQPPYINTEDYGLSSAWQYHAALADEPSRLADLPLTELSVIAPPAAFVELWRSDVRKWFTSISDPTTPQTAAMLCGMKIFSTQTTSAAIAGAEMSK